MNIKTILGACLALAALCGCATTENTPTVHLSDQLTTESHRFSIKALVDDYAVYRDGLNAHGYANLFAEEGKFHFRGNIYQGYEALKKRIEGTDPTRTTQHMMTSGEVRLNGDGTASGIHYATIYSHAGDTPRPAGEARTLNNFTVMGRYIDQYVLTEAGWKFADRRFQPLATPTP